MNKNIVNLTLTLATALSFGLACQSFKTAQNEPTTTNTSPANSVTSNTSTNKDAPDTKSSKIEKADFTVTSEEYDKEFTKKGAKEADLQKYANKIIAVSGRVSMLVTEKKGTTQPWVTLYAPGVLGGVSCYFDDDNVDQMKKLTMDKMAKIQGLQDDFIVPEVSPSLKHCVVLEGN